MLNLIFIDKIEIVVGGKVRVLNSIDQKFIFCSSEEGKLLQIENMIRDGNVKVPCLIFMQDKHRVYQIYSFLKKKLKYVEYLDSNLSLKQREEKVKLFEQGQIWILVTTDVLARGVDFPDLKLVINYDVP